MEVALYEPSCHAPCDSFVVSIIDTGLPLEGRVCLSARRQSFLSGPSGISVGHPWFGTAGIWNSGTQERKKESIRTIRVFSGFCKDNGSAGSCARIQRARQVRRPTGTPTVGIVGLRPWCSVVRGAAGPGRNGHSGGGGFFQEVQSFGFVPWSVRFTSTRVDRSGDFAPVGTRLWTRRHFSTDFATRSEISCSSH